LSLFSEKNKKAVLLWWILLMRGGLEEHTLII